MKNYLKLTSLILMLILFTSLAYASSTTVEGETYPALPIVIDGKTHEIYITWIDITKPNIRVDLALAENKIGTVDTLANLSLPQSENEEVIASINASYFNMRPDSQPASSLLINGDIQHIAEGGSIVGFDGDNKMHIETMDIKIEGSVNNQWEWPYNWKSWNINHLFYQPEGEMIFNRHYTGEFPKAPVYAVVVDQNIVTGKFEYMPEIPQNGYVIVRRNPKFLSLFKIGDRVDFKLKTVQRDKLGQSTNMPVAFNDIKMAAGAGPTLIKNGQIVLDAKSEGFTSSKFNEGAAKRSMIGVNSEGHLAMVVTKGTMTLSQLAKTAKQLGLVEAINLDGGGSSGMMYKGQYLVEPGRKISNAFIVKKLKVRPIRITLNDIEKYFDVYPFIYQTENSKPRTMVPLRGILEKIGARVDWLPETRQVKVTRFNSTLLFTVGKSEVIVDGKAYQMDVPLLIKDNRSFISVRFLTEFFGGKVDWDAEKVLVDLSLPTVEEAYLLAEALFDRKSYQMALDQYQKVLKMFPEHVSALKKSAYILDQVLGDRRLAIDNYEVYNRLGHAYRLENDLRSAIEVYNKSLAILENNVEAHDGLAKCYEKLNVEQALIHYQWIVDNSNNADYVSEAIKYINENGK